jgi:hypothetical protein
MTTYTSLTDRIRAKNPGLSDYEIRQLVKREVRRRKYHREFVCNIISKTMMVILGTIAGVCAVYGLGGVIMMLLNCFIFV